MNDKVAFVKSLLATAREKEILLVGVASFTTGPRKFRRQVISNAPDVVTQGLLQWLIQVDGTAIERAGKALLQQIDPQAKWENLPDEERGKFVAMVQLILATATRRIDQEPAEQPKQS